MNTLLQLLELRYAVVKDPFVRVVVETSTGIENFIYLRGESETSRQFEAMAHVLRFALAQVGNNDYDAVRVHCQDDLVRGVLTGHWQMTPKLYQYSKKARWVMNTLKRRGITVQIEE